MAFEPNSHPPRGPGGQLCQGNPLPLESPLEKNMWHFKYIYIYIYLTCMILDLSNLIIQDYTKPCAFLSPAIRHSAGRYPVA